jgi:hypothetical protein
MVNEKSFSLAIGGVGATTIAQSMSRGDASCANSPQARALFGRPQFYDSIEPGRAEKEDDSWNRLIIGEFAMNSAWSKLRC